MTTIGPESSLEIPNSVMVNSCILLGEKRFDYCYETIKYNIN